MKKTLLTFVALLIGVQLMAQSLDWNLDPVKSTLKTLVPNIMGVVCAVVLIGWTTWNVVTNWKDRAEILTNAAWSLIIIAICYGIVYAGMNVLL